VLGHLAHGDYLGSCSDPNPCGSSSYFIDDTDIVDDQIFELNPLTIAKEGTESDDVLIVYPNPAKDYVFIDLQMFNETTVVIDIFHPVMGLVRSLQIEPNGHDKTEVNLGMLPPGMYIISKRSEDGHRLSTKLILAN
jgi:transcription antitermination factor NusG